MPVYNQRDLIPFVNSLEERVDELDVGVRDWLSEKGSILSAVQRSRANESRSLLAIQRAEEALSEISTATFGIVAERGQRLKALIDMINEKIDGLRKDVEDGGLGGGGGKTATFDGGRIAEEINNAVSSVDGIIDNGLKLDYRIRQIEDVAKEGAKLTYKSLIVPYKHHIEDPTEREFTLEKEEGVKFLDGIVTVLNEEYEPIVIPPASIIEGVIDEEGNVRLNYIPDEPVTLYYPVEVDFNDIPKDVLYSLIETTIQKNGELVKDFYLLKEVQENILSDIEAMKGANWTIDFSIMRNHQDLVRESITPKGLGLSIIDGNVHLTFSYNDHERLSHFEIERWDEENKEFVPYKTVYKE